jgi:lysozyme
MLKGIDISHYQSFSDYEALNRSGLAFAYIKATDGISHDSAFEKHDKAISKTSLLKGAYHYLRFDAGGDIQAQNFVEKVKPVFSVLDLPPVVDIEDINAKIGPAKSEILIQSWLDHVQAALGVKPMIYTGKWYWGDPKHLNNSKKFSSYALWTAKYAASYAPMYGGWTTPAFWQYSEHGHVTGLTHAADEIDMDYFLGDIDALWSHTKSGHIAPSNQYNPKVEALQYILNQNGYHAGTQDGKFGNTTLAALHAWQDHNHIPRQDSITPGLWGQLFGIAAH